MTTVSGPRRLGAPAAALLGCLAAANLAGQSSLRSWGHAQFDTEAYALPASYVAAANSRSVVLRSDGRIFVHGGLNVPEAPAAPTGTHYTQVACSSDYSPSFCLGLLSNGSIVTWGPNAGSLQAPALPSNTTYTKIAVGAYHAVALRSDGVAVAWGSNAAGQTAVPGLPPGIGVLDIHAGGHWSTLLLTNGTLVAFGANNYGQTSVPALPTGVTYQALWGGQWHSMARRSDGTFVSWGENSAGQCNIPALPSGVTYTLMAPGDDFTAALRSDGTLVAWGSNGYGQLVVPQLPSGIACTQLVAGHRHALARLADGTVLGWGSSAYSVPTPTQPTGDRWISQSSGYPVLALLASGSIVAIGGPSDAPPLPPGLTYTEVIAGDLHRVALRSDGRAIAWGSNLWGALAIPPLPPGMTYLAAATGWDHTALLRSDGAAVVCGTWNGTIPPLPPGLRYEQIATSDRELLLLRSDGVILARNNPNTGDFVIPPPTPTGVRFVSVACGRSFEAALRSDGQIDLWGYPLQVPLPALPPGVVYVEIVAANDCLVARRSDGQVVAAVTFYPTDPMRNVPIASAGESIVGVALGSYWGVVRIGPTSTYVSYGRGCAGTFAPSRLVPADTPRLGTFHEVTLFDLPADAAILVFGWHRTPPLSLANQGLPGCSQHVTNDAAFLLLGAQRQVHFALGIPNDLILLGQHFHHQAIVLDPGANAAGAVVSDAAEGVVGR